MKKHQLPETIRTVTERLTDEGRLIEAGWRSLRYVAISKDASLRQLDDMRSAFFAGAQHLWGSIMTVLEPGSEPTSKDLQRFEQIERELDIFLAEFERKHGIRGREQ